MGYLGREVAILQNGTGPTNGRKSPPQRQNMGRCHHHGCFQQHRSWSWRRVPMSGRVCLSDAFLCFFQIVQTSIVCEGVSCGGAQRGLLDSRSALVRWIFHVFDSLPTKQQPCSQYSVFSTLLLVQ